MKHIHNNDSSAPTSSSTVRTSLRRLLALEGKTPPESPGPLDLAAWLALRFGFLPKPISFEANGDDLVIRHPSETESAKAKAAELLNRAIKRADQGDYEATARLCRRALEKQPSLHGARRELAHACVELRDLAQAKAVLLQVVWCDPDDTWGLIALGNLSLGEGDHERAERFTTLALALDPGSAEALVNLGLIYKATGRTGQAFEALHQSIAIDPAWPNAHCALARLLADQGKFEESAAAIHRLFGSAKHQDEQSGRIFESARRCYATCQKELAQRGYQAAMRTVSELQAQTEKLTGCPIRISYRETRGILSGSGVTRATDYDPGNGVLQCQLEGPEYARPHLEASTLLRFQADWEAGRRGKRRGIVITPDQLNGLVSLFGLLPGPLSPEVRGQLNAVAAQMALVPMYTLQGSAPNMLTEITLRQRFPELRPAQFMSLSEGFIENWQARQILKGRQRHRLPRLLDRTISALSWLEALFLDHLFGGVTDLAAVCREDEGFDLARKLWQHWQSKSGSMDVGDEFAILEDFADMLGLSGRFNWVASPFPDQRPQDLTCHQSGPGPEPI